MTARAGERTPLGADARWDVPTIDALRGLAGAPLPLGLRGTEPRRRLMRDLYFDTPDAALRSHGATCRFRHGSDDRRELMVALHEDTGGRPACRRVAAEVSAADVGEAFAGSSEPARLLRALASPAALAVDLELEIERYARDASRGWLGRARLHFRYDVVTVRASGLSRTFQELTVRELRAGSPALDDVARAVGAEYGLRAVSAGRSARGALVRRALESEALARGVGAGRWVAVLALDGACAACVMEDGAPRVPAAEGGGEEACRHLLRRTLGSAAGDVHRLSTVPGEGRLRSLEIWIARRVGRDERAPADARVGWLPVDELLRGAAMSVIHDAATLAALAALRRSGLLSRLSTDAWPDAPNADARASDGNGVADDPGEAERRPGTRAPPRAPHHALPLLDAEISALEFNARVLGLAEDGAVPLLERLRYLGIVSANLDEFFMVRVAGLKRPDEEVTLEDAGHELPEARLAAIADRVRALVARQYACLAACRGALEAHGIRIVAPNALDVAQREALHAHFLSTIFPYLTPRAITTTPGHSFPLIPHLALCLAVVLRDAGGSGPAHFAEIALPAELPRLVQVPGTRTFVPLEEVVRPELPLLYRGRHVEHAYAFRVTRDAGVSVDERHAGDLPQAIEEGTQRRRHQRIVRLEVERAMPATLRALLLRELLLEPGEARGGLGPVDEYEVPELLDLDGLRQVTDLPLPALRFPPFTPAAGLDAERPLWETLRERDVLVHHPFDDFGTTVRLSLIHI